MADITLWGVQLKDVPRWALAVVAIMLAALVVFIGYWTKVHQPEIELVTAKEATEVAIAEIEELAKHIGGVDVEQEYKFSEKPLMLARLYKDKCILLVSETPDGTRSKLVRDMSKDPHKIPKHSAVSFIPTVEAAQQRRTNCDGRVHPGRFDIKYGIKQGCWVPVHHIYYDGCVSVSMYDACNQIMDGRVTWLTCNH